MACGSRSSRSWRACIDALAPDSMAPCRCSAARQRRGRWPAPPSRTLLPGRWSFAPARKACVPRRPVPRTGWIVARSSRSCSPAPACSPGGHAPGPQGPGRTSPCRHAARVATVCRWLTAALGRDCGGATPCAGARAGALQFQRQRLRGSLRGEHCFAEQRLRPVRLAMRVVEARQVVQAAHMVVIIRADGCARDGGRPPQQFLRPGILSLRPYTLARLFKVWA